MFELLTFMSVNLLGVISPGPDFAIVTHYGLKGSRKAALLATAGITAALLIHVFYCVFGVAWFLQNSPTLFCALQLLGAGYLGYLGVRMFQKPKEKEEPEKGKDPGDQAFTRGFLTNLLNPKATLFLLSLFTQFITPDTSLAMKICYGVSIPVVAVSWFSLLSFLITHRSFLPYLQQYQQTFSRVMGILLLGLAASVVWGAVRSF